MKTPRPLWLRLLRFAGLGLLVVITLVALVASWLSFSGRREWARTKADLLARGEKLSLVELAPTPVPDAENFFADTPWRELSDYTWEERDGKRDRVWRVPRSEWQLGRLNDSPSRDEIARLKENHPRFARTDLTLTRAILARRALEESDGGPDAVAFAQAVLAPNEALVEKLVARLDRPAAVSSMDWNSGFTAPMDHVGPVLKLAQLLGTRVAVALAAGEPDAAFRDARSLLQVTTLLQTEPILISLLVRAATLSHSAEAIVDGTSRHAWTGDQLEELQERLAAVDLPDQLALALRGERGAFNHFLEGLRHSQGNARQEIASLLGLSGGNPGWAMVLSPYLDLTLPSAMAYHNRTLQRAIDAVEAGTRLDQGVFAPFDPAQIPLTQPLSRVTLPALSNVGLRIAETQDRVTMAVAACALERFRLAEGHYPATLAELAPTYLAGAPLDVVKGQPLRYERTAEGFRLWTPGWDEDDDGGSPADRKGLDGDWVWGVDPRRKKP